MGVRVRVMCVGISWVKESEGERERERKREEGMKTRPIDLLFHHFCLPCVKICSDATHTPPSFHFIYVLAPFVFNRTNAT